MGETFQVDHDAHEKAKVDGDYTPDGSGKSKDDDTTDGEAEGSDDSNDDDVKISDIDPGDDDDADEGADDDEDEEKDDAANAADAFQTTAQGWTEEFLENGELSDETRETVIKTVFAEGVPDSIKEEFVKTYEAGSLSLRDAATQEVFAMAGGQEQYQAMLQWGVDNLSEEEVSAFDADALGTDMVKRNSAVKGLYARMQQATGAEPDSEPDLSHDGGRQKGEPIISSRRELVQIQRTAEYKKDPAVRAKVARQLRYSMNTGLYDDGQS